MAIYTGTSGQDTLTGTTASDRITGGAGTDMLTGGGGADVFVDTAAGLNGDTITDFGLGDHLVITDVNISQIAIALVGNTLSYTGGFVTLSDYPAGRLIVTAAAGGGVDLRFAGPAANDFNGDGHSDILWRNTSGALSDWLANFDGGFVSNDANALTNSVPVSWGVAGTGDFDGDGIVDVLWRNTSGALSNWLGRDDGGFQRNDAAALTQVPTDWNVVGTGDFNGDGRADILWRRDSGTLSDWLGTATGGFAVNDTNALAEVPTSWKVAGTGDFNGDGLSDILWRNDDGRVSNWLGKANGGFTVNDGAAGASVAISWTVAGTGDFNGDGFCDIAWRNSNGALSNWLGTATGGFTPNDANALAQVATSWTVVATGDYNGDGIDDILWRNSSGALTNWLGVAGSGGWLQNDAFAFTVVANSWHVQPEPFMV